MSDNVFHFELTYSSNAQDVLQAMERHINRNVLEMSTEQVMTENPQTIQPDALATSAVAILNEKSITALFAIEDDRPVGVVHLHDLLRIGVA